MEDLLLGGTLRHQLRAHGSLSEETARFYIACVALALDYLHSHRIVHRSVLCACASWQAKGHR